MAFIALHSNTFGWPCACESVPWTVHYIPYPMQRAIHYSINQSINNPLSLSLSRCHSIKFKGLNIGSHIQSKCQNVIKTVAVEIHLEGAQRYLHNSNTRGRKKLGSCACVKHVNPEVSVLFLWFCCWTNVQKCLIKEAKWVKLSLYGGR